MIKDILWYVLAAIGEIIGCYAFWGWWRLDKSPLWLVPGVCALMVFAFALSQTSPAFAGRAFAAYGGIYIIGALIWMVVIEKTLPNRWDLMGAGLCLIGAVVIVLGNIDWPPRRPL